ncbi:unnamed protein product [Paramecium primaurelia]|uniref:Kinesin motor domain-containing protein n=1 Tax=Paramecium primaurelia TaxID=5886 RepID=A0A8S1L1S0_PARPR|nr:unnamed protein product [Paramecium primaurelia]
MKLVCRLRPQPNNTSSSTVNSKKDVRTNIFAGALSNESPQTIVVSSRNAISQKIIQEYLKNDSDIMKQRQSIIENSDLFQFDQVFGEKANQQLVYDQVMATKVNNLITGQSGLLLIVGGPKSGKKYTLKGEERGQEKGLAVMIVENIFNLIESSKQLRGKGKLNISISLVNNIEVIDLIGSSRSQTVKFSQVKSASEFKKMLNQSLFQYKQYVKEHPDTKNNHIFVKYLIEQDKQEVAQLHLILFNDLRRVTQEAKDFQAKLKQLLVSLQDFQEKELESKSLLQLYLSLRETKFNNITVLFCVSQVQQDHITAYMTLQFAEDLRQTIKPSTQRIALSQLDNQSIKSKSQLGRDNLIQQFGSKESIDEKFDQPSRIVKPGVSDQIMRFGSDQNIKPGLDQTVLHQSKMNSTMMERQPSRQEVNFSKQFQELKDLLKEKEVMEDYKVQRFEKELKNLYEENSRLQNKTYQQEDSIRQRDLLIQQLEQHMDDNKKKMEAEHQLFTQAKQKENIYEQNQEELNEALAQLNQQLRYGNEESQLQKQKIRVLENDIEKIKEQELKNMKHYEKREDEFINLIQQEQERNKQLYQELNYFAIDIKNRDQQLQANDENIKTLNKVIEEQSKRIEEEKQKNKELCESVNNHKLKQEEAIRDINQIEQRFTRLKVKLETENQQLKQDKEKYLQKYKEKLKKYKTQLKQFEQENGQMKIERVKLETENDQLYGISKQLETQLGRVHSETTERIGGSYDAYEQEKIRQQNYQLNNQLKQTDYEIKQLSLQLNNAIQQLEQTNIEYDHILQENQKLKQLLDDKQSEAKKNEFMIEKVVELSDKQLDDLESKFNKLTAQINSLQHEKKSLQLENQNLKNQLEQMDGNDIVLEKRIVKLRKENKDLSNQVRQLNQNMKEMIIEKHSEMRNTSLRQSRYSNKLLSQNQSYRSQRLIDHEDDDII